MDCDFVPEGDDCVDSAVGACAKVSWQGDGFCDDVNNNAACDWVRPAFYTCVCIYCTLSLLTLSLVSSVFDDCETVAEAMVFELFVMM